jgi:phosphoribosylglycinamide formyltransferase-1
MVTKTRVGVLVSGGGSNLQAILDASESNRVDAEIVSVCSDNPAAQGLERARKHGIPTAIVDYDRIMGAVKEKRLQDVVPGDFDLEGVLVKQGLFDAAGNRQRLERYFSLRAIAEAALLRELESHSFDLLALAGFMRILTPYFIDRVNTDPSKPRIMNIHPALLPSFPGVDGYGDTYRYGCKVAGCTVHFVDYGEDTGPIIGQRAFEIRPEDTLDTVREKGLRQEWELYPDCIQLFSEDRLKVVTKTHALKDGTTLKRKVVEIFT